MNRSSGHTATSNWRFFPHAMISALMLLVAVDMGLVWTALRSFPGLAAADVFDHSNRYDEVLEVAAREAALGWSMTATTEHGIAMVTLAGHDGAALSGLKVAGVAERPLGAPLTTPVSFHEVRPGVYAAQAKLVEQGQWELRLVASGTPGTLHATRRVVVR